MEGGIETLTQCFDFPNPEAFQRLAENPPGSPHALEQCRIPLTLGNVMLSSLDRPLQIVSDLQKLACKIGDGISPRRIDCTFGTTTRVLCVGECPQQSIL